jgi:cytochrome c oxidase cbb3-type subunit I/II
MPSPTYRLDYSHVHVETAWNSLWLLVWLWLIPRMTKGKLFSTKLIYTLVGYFRIGTYALPVACCRILASFYVETIQPRWTLMYGNFSTETVTQIIQCIGCEWWSCMYIFRNVYFSVQYL